MQRYFQRALDAFYWLRKAIMDGLTFVTLRAYGIEVLYSDVKAGRYEKEYRPLDLENAQAVDAVLAEAEKGMERDEKRREIIMGKNRMLITLASLLITVVGLLLPKYFAFDAAWMRYVAVAAMLLLFNVIIIFLRSMDVAPVMEVSLKQCDLILRDEDFKRRIASNLLQCRFFNELCTDYLVDLYRACRFCFLAAFVGIAGLCFTNFLISDPGEVAGRMIRELRSDARLVELLRGPRGAAGEVGRIGPRGRDGVVDHARILDGLFADPRFNEALQKRLETIGEGAEPAKGGRKE